LDLTHKLEFKESRTALGLGIPAAAQMAIELRGAAADVQRGNNRVIFYTSVQSRFQQKDIM
jgi:hypothetical protein